MIAEVGLDIPILFSVAKYSLLSKIYETEVV